MEKIIVLDGHALNPGDLSWEPLKEFGELIVYDRIDEKEIVEKIGDATCIFTNKVRITKDIIDKCKNLKYIGVLATGFDIVDTKAAKEKNIVVCNVPSYSTDSVAQLVFALILEICNSVATHSESVFKGEWERCEDFCYRLGALIELSGKTIGIVGFGSIGRAAAKIAEAFGMKVLAYSRNRDLSLETENCKYAELDYLYANSDVISLHCPMSESTASMINKESISKMKDTAILINTARGGLVSEQDLADALNSNKLYAAAVDVVSAEPIEASNPLLKAKNLLITPHIAWGPIEARSRLMDITVNNLRQFTKNAPVNVVNK